MKLEFSGQIFEKFSNFKFHKNPSSWNRVVPCGQTDGRTDGETDRHNEADSFRNFTKVLKKFYGMFTVHFS
jgi:hypothetical protein